MTSSAVERFWSKVDRDGPNGCFVWSGGLVHGYGQFKTGGVQYIAHRWIYLQTRGPIQDGLQLDHLCRNRACVNPDHMEPVTNRENVLRGVGIPAINAKKTHCKNGHPFEGDNIYVRVRPGARSGRECRTCKNEKKRNRRALARHQETVERAKGDD